MEPASFHIKRLNQKNFYSDINRGKKLPKTVETSQPLLNVLLLFIITENFFGSISLC